METKIMLNKSDLVEDQQNAIDYMYEHDRILLIAPTGGGKTVCSMTAARELLDDGVIKRVLIVSTKKVANNVWRDEYKKWSHLQHSRVDVATGNDDQRTRCLHNDSEFVITTFGLLPWFFDVDWRWHKFDALIIDEVKKCADTSTEAFKALRYKIKNFKWYLGMTADIVPEDYTSLYGACLLIDGGATFGTNKDKFLWKYFFPADRNMHRWNLIPGSAEKIAAKLARLTYVMPDYKHTLPPIHYHDVWCDMNEHTINLYKTMARKMFVDTPEGRVLAKNAAVKSMKLEQLTQGFLYQGENNDTRVSVHETKLEALKNMITPEMGNIVIVYWFTEELDILLKAFPQGKALGGSQTEREADQIIKDWNMGKLPMLFLQPQGSGHGLNIAQGGYTMIFYCLPWSNDLFKQTRDRLWRRGQAHEVQIYRILMRMSIDDLKTERLEEKGEHNPRLINHLNDVINNM